MSSNDFVIRANNLSKCYQIYDAPHDRLKQFTLPRLQKLVGIKQEQYFKEFWALKDVSFEIKRGETVGIIGRNGSGKSTLLQLICGTLTPSNGTVEINGRVAALLELGSGFNPEYSGRDNIYMYASVLGLSTEEVDKRYEKIVAFADIGDFIEQAIKTYSSGMTMRLAFAVIAHVDADILVIDEALAVGDAIFTQKCMRFLRRFMEFGTVLFVSHDVNAINNMCQQSIWLSDGVIRMFADAETVSKEYTQYCNQEVYGESVKLNSIKKPKVLDDKSNKPEEDDTRISFFEDIANSDGWKTGAAEVVGVEIMTVDERPVTLAAGGERVLLIIRVHINQTLLSPIVGFFVKDKLGQSLFGEHTYTYVQPPCSAHAGDVLEAKYIFNLPLLPNGDYSMTVSIADGTPENHTQHHWLHDAVIIHVQSNKLRYGLVGIPFESVSMSKI
jgi:lipopolysaccharide transport system ATP-binding protein